MFDYIERLMWANIAAYRGPDVIFPEEILVLTGMRDEKIRTHPSASPLPSHQYGTPLLHGRRFLRYLTANETQISTVLSLYKYQPDSVKPSTEISMKSVMSGHEMLF